MVGVHPPQHGSLPLSGSQSLRTSNSSFTPQINVAAGVPTYSSYAQQAEPTLYSSPRFAATSQPAGYAASGENQLTGASYGNYGYGVTQPSTGSYGYPVRESAAQQTGTYAPASFAPSTSPGLQPANAAYSPMLQQSNDSYLQQPGSFSPTYSTPSYSPAQPSAYPASSQLGSAAPALTTPGYSPAQQAGAYPTIDGSAATSYSSPHYPGQGSAAYNSNTVPGHYGSTPAPTQGYSQAQQPGAYSNIDSSAALYSSSRYSEQGSAAYNSYTVPAHYGPQ